MILKGSQRSGAKQLGQHLLNTQDNEHVEVHEVSGFAADDLMGAMREAYAVSLGTKCRQHLFSVSLSPPPSAPVRTDVFENACRMIEERMGLTGQPRVIVFHEKEGRRHAHAVWSRIDPQTMTARPMSFFKMKLRAISRDLFLENGWSMPEGLRDYRLRDPRNMSLAEWQQSKRGDLDPREVKAAIRESWTQSDNGASFARALEERGMYLARGERNNHVAVTVDGRVFAIPRVTGERTKAVRARLGDPAQLKDVPATIRQIGETVAPRLSRYISEAKRIAHNAMKPLNERKTTMKQNHSTARDHLAEKHRERGIAEQRARSERVRKGVAGVWDILTGRYFRTRKQNEMEAHFCGQRDRTERHDLIAAQMKERQSLQHDIEKVRERHASQVLGLYRDMTRYRAMTRGDYIAREGAERGRGDRQVSRGPELG